MLIFSGNLLMKGQVFSMRKHLYIMLALIVCIIIACLISLILFSSNFTRISYDHREHLQLQQLAGPLKNYSISFLPTPTSYSEDVKDEQKKGICSVLENTTFRGITKAEFKAMYPLYKGNIDDILFDRELLFNYSAGQNSSLKREIGSFDLLVANSTIYIVAFPIDGQNAITFYACEEDILADLQEFVPLYSITPNPTQIDMSFAVNGKAQYSHDTTNIVAELSESDLSQIVNIFDGKTLYRGTPPGSIYLQGDFIKIQFNDGSETFSIPKDGFPIIYWENKYGYFHITKDESQLLQDILQKK